MDISHEVTQNLFLHSRAPYTVLCQWYDQECQTFNLHGALHDILGEYHHNVQGLLQSFMLER
jgi:hypothetical protein